MKKNNDNENLDAALVQRQFKHSNEALAFLKFLKSILPILNEQYPLVDANTVILTQDQHHFYQLHQAQITGKSPHKFVAGQFLVKTLRADSHAFPQIFVKEIIPGENGIRRHNLRYSERRKFVVMPNGKSVRRSEKPEQYTPAQKVGFSQHQSMTFIDEETRTRPFGLFAERYPTLHGFMTPLSDALINRAIVSDSGTVGHMFDFDNDPQSEEHTGIAPFYPPERMADFIAHNREVRRRDPKHNEVLARIRYNSCLSMGCVFADTLEARLLADDLTQEIWAEYNVYAKRNGIELNPKFKIPVVFYTLAWIGDNHKIKFYTEDMRKDDRAKAQRIFDDEKKRFKHYSENRYEFLLGIHVTQEALLSRDGSAQKLPIALRILMNGKVALLIKLFRIGGAAVEEGVINYFLERNLIQKNDPLIAEFIYVEAFAIARKLIDATQSECAKINFRGVDLPRHLIERGNPRQLHFVGLKEMLELALKHKKWVTIKLCLKEYPDIDRSLLGKILSQACEAQNDAEVKFLLRMGAQLHQQDQQALHTQMLLAHELAAFEKGDTAEPPFSQYKVILAVDQSSVDRATRVFQYFVEALATNKPLFARHILLKYSVEYGLISNDADPDPLSTSLRAIMPKMSSVIFDQDPMILFFAFLLVHGQLTVLLPYANDPEIAVFHCEPVYALMLRHVKDARIFYECSDWAIWQNVFKAEPHLVKQASKEFLLANVQKNDFLISLLITLDDFDKARWLIDATHSDVMELPYKNSLLINYLAEFGYGNVQHWLFIGWQTMFRKAVHYKRWDSILARLKELPKTDGDMSYMQVDYGFALLEAVKSKQVDLVRLLIDLGPKPFVTAIPSESTIFWAVELELIDLIAPLIIYEKQHDTLFQVRMLLAYDLACKKCMDAVSAQLKGHIEMFVPESDSDKMDVISGCFFEALALDKSEFAFYRFSKYCREWGVAGDCFQAVLSSERCKANWQFIFDKALHLSIKNDQFDLADLLLSLGANPRYLCENDCCNKPKNILAMYQLWEGVEPVHLCKFDCVGQMTKYVRRSEHKGNAIIVQRLLDDFNLTEQELDNFLHCALESGQNNKYRLVIDHGAIITMEHLKSAFSKCAGWGCEEKVTFVIEKMDKTKVRDIAFLRDFYDIVCYINYEIMDRQMQNIEDEGFGLYYIRFLKAFLPTHAIKYLILISVVQKLKDFSNKIQAGEWENIQSVFVELNARSVTQHFLRSALPFEKFHGVFDALNTFFSKPELLFTAIPSSSQIDAAYTQVLNEFKALSRSMGQILNNIRFTFSNHRHYYNFHRDELIHCIIKYLEDADQILRAIPSQSDLADLTSPMNVVSLG